jgi:hypothetical protein
MRRALLAVVTSLLTACALAGTASAKPSGFTWDVGNTDIQTAFGWTDAQLQSNESGLSFSVSGDIDRFVTCSIAVGPNGKVIQQAHSESRSVNTGVAFSMGADGVTLLNLPDPAALPNPLGACTGALRTQSPPFLVFSSDDLSAHMNIYATYQGQTALVGFVAL